MPLHDGALVDVPTDDHVRARRRERLECCIAICERELARGAPRRPGEVVVKDDDAECAGRRIAQDRGCVREAVGAQAPALVAPGPRGVEAARDDAVERQHRPGCPEHRLEGTPRSCEPRRHRVGDVVVPWDCEQGSGETVEHGLRLFELGRAAAVREVAACDDERRRQLEAGCHQRVVHIGLAVDAAMEVGDMDCACGHRRVRLYTRPMSDQSPEIFDDVYLGLQAGGALRKQRRGEELTEQEEAALGHWQRLSLWRKAFAIGAFAIGTFGLGFTLGGLIFGRRRARA